MVVCAQRLPASRRAGHRMHGKADVPIKVRCSTPSGITASGTRTRSTRSCSTCSGAQRLPASRRAGLRSDLRDTSRSSRAQRLPASRRAGQRYAARLEAGQACSTPSGITASGTLPPEKPGPGRECSTPSGITASGTRSSSVPPAGRVRVLNAFRHHGERDSPSESPNSSANLPPPFSSTSPAFAWVVPPRPYPEPQSPWNHSAFHRSSTYSPVKEPQPHETTGEIVHFADTGLRHGEVLECHSSYN